MEAYIAGVASYIGTVVAYILLVDAIADYRVFKYDIKMGRNDIESIVKPTILSEAVRFIIQFAFAVLITIRFVSPGLLTGVVSWVLASIPVLVLIASVYSYYHKKRLLERRTKSDH